jgi:IS30 family transposase
MAHKQLTLEKRYEIKAYFQVGFSKTSIAQKTKVHKSTITRELKRNSSISGYYPKAAERKSRQRRQNARKHIKFTKDLQLKVDALLLLDFSPEQISGRLKKEKNISISHERIYQYIREDRAFGGQVWKNLRHSNKVRKKRNKTEKRGQIPDRVFIDERPKIVDQRGRVGDWEADTLWKPREKGAILTLVERKTGYTLLSWLPDRKAKRIAETINTLLSDFKEHVHTLTVDNGKEFAEHKRIAKKLNAKVYFAHPYHSWERGTVENTNGLIRQYFPRKMKLDPSVAKLVPFVQQRLNLRPRKRLNYFTPFEKIYKLSVAFIC